MVRRATIPSHGPRLHGGIDKLYGGKGVDELYGGADGDKFYFELRQWRLIASKSDTIHDFTDGDKIYLNGSYSYDWGYRIPNRERLFDLAEWRRLRSLLEQPC